MKQRILISVTLVIILFTTACGGGNDSGQIPTLIPNPISITKPTFEVLVGDVTKVIQLNGRVTPKVQENLFYRVDGMVKEVLAKVGDMVMAGDVLARLDEPERYLADIASAELAVANALRELEQARINSPINFMKANEELSKSKRELDLAMEAAGTLSYYLEHPQTFNGKTESEIRLEVEQAQTAYEGASAAYDEGKGKPDQEQSDLLIAMLDTYRVLQNAQTRLTLVAGRTNTAQSKLDLARAKYESALATVQRWTITDPSSDYALAELKYKDALARLDLASLSRESNEIKASMDGQVISLSITAGSQIKAFQIVATVANMDVLEVTAIPGAGDLPFFGIGQAATVKINNVEGQVFQAQISGLPVQAGQQSTTDQTVHFEIERGSTNLQIGNSATIAVTVESRTNVLWLPLAAIRTYQGESYVLIQEGGLVRRVNVIIGLKSSDRVEILSGLEAGQMVMGQ